MIDMASGFIERYSTVLTLLVGAVAITGVLWRLVLRPMLVALRELAEQMQALRSVAEAQLTTNGGGSLVDKVNKIESNHTTAEEHWTGLEAMIAAGQVEAAKYRAELDKRLKAIEDKAAPTVVVNTGPGAAE